MLYKKLFSVLCILGVTIFSASAQQKFDMKWLEQPYNFTSEIESCFEYSEIDTYKPEESIYVCFLKNGYAQANFENPEKWIPKVANRRVLEITIVFSKYPYFKEDWITNYYDLLSRRLISLFRLDPTLNSAKIKWKLLVQNQCKTEADALKLLHGIEIRSEYFSLEEKDKNNSASNNYNLKLESLPDSLLDPTLNQPASEDEYWDYDYKQQEKWQQSNEDYQKQFKKKPKKQQKSPKCPDFSKKRRFRIF